MKGGGKGKSPLYFVVLGNWEGCPGSGLWAGCLKRKKIGGWGNLVKE